MTRIFVLAADMMSSEAALQLALTLPCLPRDQFDVRIGVLGDLEPAAMALRDAGFPVQRSPFRHAIDLGGLKQLRKLSAEAHVLHAVGPLAVRLSRFLHTPRFVASSAAEGSGLVGWLTDRQLRTANRVLAFTDRDVSEYRRRGVANERIVRIPLAAPSPASMDGDTFRRSLKISTEARLILTGGPLVAATGLRDAIWAFDGFRHESHDLHLVIVGSGPERERLDAFGRAVGYDDYRIHFTGERPDLPALLSLAEVVWVTAMRGGQSLTLGAMAAGKPIVAWQGSEAAELIRNGESGLLVPRNDRIALASKTVALVNDAGLSSRLGTAARERTLEHDPHRASEALADVYSSV